MQQQTRIEGIRNNLNVSFVVPFPHYLFRSVPPLCIQFQGTAELLSIDDPIVVKAFQSSIVLKRSMEHSLRIGESIFIRIVPDKKIFCFRSGASLLKFLIAAKNKNLGNFFVIVPENRRRM
jgi:hypothetical protein